MELTEGARGIFAYCRIGNMLIYDRKDEGLVCMATGDLGKLERLGTETYEAMPWSKTPLSSDTFSRAISRDGEELGAKGVSFLQCQRTKAFEDEVNGSLWASRGTMVYGLKARVAFYKVPDETILQLNDFAEWWRKRTDAEWTVRDIKGRLSNMAADTDVADSDVSKLRPDLLAASAALEGLAGNPSEKWGEPRPYRYFR